jgi:hypothetical protein
MSLTSQHLAPPTSTGWISPALADKSRAVKMADAAARTEIDIRNERLKASVNPQQMTEYLYGGKVRSLSLQTQPSTFWRLNGMQCC